MRAAKPLWIAALAAVALAGAAPARADSGGVPPGDPCGTGQGQGANNPCHGNNGNQGQQGNSGHAKVVTSRPDPFVVARPDALARGAYIEQVGDSDRASIRQANPTAYARIDQRGDRNRAAIEQRGGGNHYATATSLGADNVVLVRQDGEAGQVAVLSQQGDRNSASLSQSGAGGNGALMSQLGSDNRMALAQDGDGNQARLSQEGDGNAMSAVQTGAANLLVWKQVGNNLTNLEVSQSGGQAIQILQSR